MHLSTITISSKGQMVLPKKVRSIINSSTIAIQINEHNQIVLIPVIELGGILSSYKKEITYDSTSSIRNDIWQESTKYRTVISDTLSKLLTYKIECEQDVFLLALQHYSSESLHIVDCLLLAESQLKSMPVLSFDQKLNYKLKKYSI